MPGIEQLMKPSGEFAMKRIPLVFRKFVGIRIRLKPSLREPLAALVFPVFVEGGWHGIGEPRSDEIGAVPLSPVREIESVAMH